MTRQPHRLPADSKHGFGGNEIDRSKPLTFRLNGRSFEAFEGDTVISALLAAGVDTVGRYGADAIALESASAPPVALARKARSPGAAVPMDRAPVVAGQELVTVGPRLDILPQRGLAARVAALVTDRHSLGHRLDDPRAFDVHDASGTETRTCDTLVVGGGISGMTAAIAAAAAGDSVILVERRPSLGGDARFFGTVGEEASPQLTIEKLTGKVAEAPGLTVLLRTEGMVLAGTRLRAQQVVAEGTLEGRELAIEARRVILATGSTERLPVFQGNRAPGVVSTVEAYLRVERYGVWSGKRALFATPNNYGYRLALLASDAGVDVGRVVDSRIGPQSRFIDFCKASGITLGSGLVPQSADPVKGRDLRVSFAVAVEDAAEASSSGAVTTELFVVAGGWQPRLNLWLMAGGPAAYDYGRRWLAASGELENVELVGAAAGWRSSTACLASAEAAVARQHGRKAKPVEEYEVDAIYESAEAPAPVAPWRPGRGAYLDRGRSFTTRPAPAKDGGAAIQPGDIGLLSLGDVASFVQIGAIPDRDAGIIAQERCLAPEEIADTGWQVSPAPPAALADPVPVYLAGRYGPRPQLAVLEAADGRRLETGCLVFPRSDAVEPEEAIGSILGPAPSGKSGAVAVTSRTALSDAPKLFVRDTSGPVAVTLVEKL